MHYRMKILFVHYTHRWMDARTNRKHNASVAEAGKKLSRHTVSFLCEYTCNSIMNITICFTIVDVLLNTEISGWCLKEEQEKKE